MVVGDAEVVDGFGAVGEQHLLDCRSLEIVAYEQVACLQFVRGPPANTVDEHRVFGGGFKDLSANVQFNHLRRQLEHRRDDLRADWHFDVVLGT